MMNDDFDNDNKSLAALEIAGWLILILASMYAGLLVLQEFFAGHLVAGGG